MPQINTDEVLISNSSSLSSSSTSTLSSSSTLLSSSLDYGTFLTNKIYHHPYVHEHTLKKSSEPESENSILSESDPLEKELFLLKFIHQHACQLWPIKPTQKNLDKLGQYCRRTGLGQGFICTKGQDHFKFRDLYPLKDTYALLCLDSKRENILGFVMWTHRYVPENHKSITLAHESLSTSSQLEQTCLIMNLCASKVAPRGTGTLLLLWAMCHAQRHLPRYNGSILFVGKKRVKFVNTDHNTGNNTDHVQIREFSSYSAINLYQKLGFEPVTGYYPHHNEYNEFLIRYKKEPLNLNFIMTIMSKYM